MRELMKKVFVWGRCKGLDKVGFAPQLDKTLEEISELLLGYAQKDLKAINDAIGDVFVTLIVGASNDKRYLDELYQDAVHSESVYTTTRPAIRDFADAYIDLCNFTFYAKKLGVNAQRYKVIIHQLGIVLDAINEEFKQSLTLKDCLELAYNEIRWRKGKLVNGQFVKETMEAK